MMKNVSEKVNGEERTSILSFWLPVFLAFHSPFDLFIQSRGNISCGGFQTATQQHTHPNKHTHTHTVFRGATLLGKTTDILRSLSLRISIRISK